MHECNTKFNTRSTSTQVINELLMFFRDCCLTCVWWRRTFFTFQNGEQLSTATFLCPASTLFRVIMEQVPVKVSAPMTSRSGRCRSPTIIANNNMTCTQRDLGEKLRNEMPEIYEPNLPSRSSLSPGYISTIYVDICEYYAIYKKYIPISPQLILYSTRSQSARSRTFRIDHNPQINK